MKSRRDFCRHAGKAIVAAAMLPAPTILRPACGAETRIRIGIIGAENSHTVGYGRLFNVNKTFPGITVDYVWGETDAFAENAAKKGKIPAVVKDPLDMMGKIDALIVDHRHAKYHLEAALPFVKAKIPTFVDKPFCYRVGKGRSFLQTAREHGTPVSSFSSVAQSEKVTDMRAQFAAMEGIQHVIMHGPADIASKYGGIFFYGVHIVQPMLNIFGEEVERVRINRNGAQATASVVYASGLMATLLFTKERSRGTYVVTKGGLKAIESRVPETDPPKHYRDMVTMFRTGREPRRHASILKCTAVLQALEQSVDSGKWVEVIS